METVALHGPRLGIARLCTALKLPRATYYLQLEARTPRPRPTPARALSASERQAVLAVLHEPRYVNLASAGGGTQDHVVRDVGTSYIVR
jgi:putative transposase